MATHAASSPGGAMRLFGGCVRLRRGRHRAGKDGAERAVDSRERSSRGACDAAYDGPASGVRDQRAGAVVTERCHPDACSYEGDAVLFESMVVSTVAVTDLDLAKAFFGEQLGLALLEETPFALRFGAGKGTQLSVRKGQPNVGQTVAHFEVDDIEAVVRDLTSRGVEFQEYETPKTVDFIAQVGPARGAWFADADGNVFGVREGPVPGSR
jgi:catechol 2,3-dioxygenase-like lactoylglutathione lyase family enzyme